MADDGGALLTAFVQLRAKAASNFESEARESLLPGLGRIAADAASLVAEKKLFDIGKEGIDRLGELQKTAAQTGVVLRDTGGAAGVSAAGVEELAASLGKMSGVDHEAIAGAENLILQMTNVRNTVGAGHDIFDRATKDSLDLSVAMGTDVKSAASTLGLALEDPVAGMAKLRRAHVVLSEEQKTAIKNFVAVGDTASAQAVILDQVEKQVGGSAKAYGETLPGELAKAQTAMKDAKAAMTAGLAPALEAGAGLVTGLAQRFSELPQPVQEVGGAVVLLGGGIAALVGPAADAAKLITTLKDAHRAAAAAAEVQAAKELELAGAEETEALAAETTTTKTGGLASALGKGGLGLAAAAGVAALYEYGQSLNKTTVSTDDLAKITKLSGADATKVFEDLARNSVGPFSGVLDDAIGKLAAMGPAGVGTLTEIRDQLKAAGEDTSKYDAAIAGAAQSQTNMNNATTEGNAALSDVPGAVAPATEAEKNLAAQLGEVTKQLDAQRSAQDSLLGSRITLDESNLNFKDSLNKILEAQAATNHATGVDAIAAQEALQKAVLASAGAAEQLAQKTADAQVAMDAANGTTDSAAQKSQIQRDALKQLADQLAPDSPLRKYLDQYIYTLNSIPGQKDTVLSAHYDVNTQPTTAHTTARAAGGPVSAGQVFMGAEYGPELLLTPGRYQAPAGGGVVIPAAQTAAMLAGGGGHVHHHYQVIVQPVASDTLESAVRRELGRMESLRVLQSAGG